MADPAAHRLLSAGERTAALVATSDNPVPPGAVVSAIAARDGVLLRAVRWMPRESPPRGTVAIFPGHSEFIEKYAEVAGELLARGLAVAALDWRGQGGSMREVRNARKGHVDDFSHYRRDLAALIEQVLEPFCPRPWFGLAHSMGAAILAAAAHDGFLPFERQVLVAPMLKIAVIRRPGPARLLARTLDVLGFGGHFVPGGGATAMNTRPFENNPLTSDPVRYARNAAIIAAAPHLAVGAPTIGWINAAFRLCALFEDADYPRETFLPTLVFACGGDRIVDTPMIERFATRLKAGWHILVPYARHELLMERDVFREQFWAAFDAFVPGTRAELETLGGQASAGRRSAR
jgi:lysophospholipase